MGLGFFLGVLLGKMENKEKEDNETASIFADAVGLGIGNLFPIMLIILRHYFLMISFHSSQLPACWAEFLIREDSGLWPKTVRRLAWEKAETVHCSLLLSSMCYSYKNTFTKLL